MSISPDSHGGLANFFGREFVGLSEHQRLWFTEVNALRVAPAKIAFENDPLGGVKPNRPVRTGGHACLAGNAPVIVDHDSSPAVIPGNGLFGARFFARRIRAMLATHRQKYPFPVPLQNVYP